MKDNTPIGVFDSGIGGLTVVKELRKIMPAEDIIYVGDTARVPYGSRKSTEIIAFMEQILNFLQMQKVKMAVIACNTMTAYGYEKMLNKYPFALIPMNSGVKNAVAVSLHKHVGVIATEGTIKNEMHRKSAWKIDEAVKVYPKACPEFVPLIEKGMIRGGQIESAVKNYMSFFKDTEVESLILGCTHYPLIADIIQKYMGNDVHLINPAKATAKDAFNRLNELNLINQSSQLGNLKMCFSGDLDSAKAMSKLILTNEKIEFELVDLTRYS